MFEHVHLARGQRQHGFQIVEEAHSVAALLRLAEVDVAGDARQQALAAIAGVILQPLDEVSAAFAAIGAVGGVVRVGGRHLPVIGLRPSWASGHEGEQGFARFQRGLAIAAASGKGFRHGVSPALTQDKPPACESLGRYRQARDRIGVPRNKESVSARRSPTTHPPAMHEVQT